MHDSGILKLTERLCPPRSSLLISHHLSRHLPFLCASTGMESDGVRVLSILGAASSIHQRHACNHPSLQVAITLSEFVKLSARF